jgi:hypothetical protein
VAWLRRLATGLPLQRPWFDPGSFYLGFVVEKMALGQVFTWYFGLPLSMSFHWCSITRKRTIIIVIIINPSIVIIIIFIIRLHKKP